MDFGTRIKARRKELGLTLEEVGNIVGVGKSTVRKWETGDIANMRRDKIARLAVALQVSPSELIGWDMEDYTDKLMQKKLDEEAELAEKVPAGVIATYTSKGPTVLARFEGFNQQVQDVVHSTLVTYDEILIHGTAEHAKAVQQVVELIEGLNDGGLNLLLEYIRTLGRTEKLIDEKSRYWNGHYGNPSPLIWDEDDDDDTFTPAEEDDINQLYMELASDETSSKDSGNSK